MSSFIYLITSIDIPFNQQDGLSKNNAILSLKQCLFERKN